MIKGLDKTIEIAGKAKTPLCADGRIQCKTIVVREVFE